MPTVVQGVSTRRMKKITTERCGREFCSSTVSRRTEDLDKQVDGWASRFHDQGFPFFVLDASGSRWIDDRDAWLLAREKTGRRRFWSRQLSGLSETEEGRRRFIHGFTEHGLSGVELPTSAAHPGLIRALKEAFPAVIWKRCQAHVKPNILDQTLASYKGQMDQVLDQILEASSQQKAQTRFDAVSGELEEEAPAAYEILEGVLVDATAVLALSEEYCRHHCTTNMLERFIEDIRRRE